MDKMKTLKIASKYLLMLATFCILSENYLCYTKVIEETPNYATKEYVTTSTTTRRSRTLKNIFNFSERRESRSEIFRKRRAYVQDTCMIHKQKLPNLTG